MDQRLYKRFRDGGEQLRRDVSGYVGGSGGAGGANGGVGVSETADDGGDHLGEVRRERLAVVARHERQDGDGVFSHRRFR